MHEGPEKLPVRVPHHRAARVLGRRVLTGTMSQFVVSDAGIPWGIHAGLCADRTGPQTFKPDGVCVVLEWRSDVI